MRSRGEGVAPLPKKKILVFYGKELRGAFVFFFAHVFSPEAHGFSLRALCFVCLVMFFRSFSHLAAMTFSGLVVSSRKMARNHFQTDYVSR